MIQQQKSQDRSEFGITHVSLGISGLFKSFKRYNCPCCGYPTMKSFAAYEVCELCDWEDDGQGDHNADEITGGPNRDYSLTLARENFTLYLSMYEPSNNPTIIGNDNDVQIFYKQKLIKVFNAIQAANRLTKNTSNTGLWNKVLKIEKQLYKELLEKLKEYEISQVKIHYPNL